MAKQKHNLNTKKITEFTPEDTIYIKDKSDFRGLLYLCQFVKYDKDKRLVEGVVIDCDDHRELDKIKGKTLINNLSKCALYGNASDDISRSYYRFFDSSLYAMHPLEEHKITGNDLHIPKHPSYGMAGFSRRSSSHGVSLFGSSIQNKQTISLTIKRAKHERSLNDDHYFSQGTLIEVEMSQTQFAELITAFNMGDGIPCTINYFNGEQYPEPPFQSKVDVFNNEFQKEMHNFSIDMKKLVEQTNDILANKTNITKGDREIIKNNIDRLIKHIENSIPFMSRQFVESMENTVTEAKAQIEAYVENQIRTKGLESLGFNKEDQTPRIDNGDK